jgi:hypothetical protein
MLYVCRTTTYWAIPGLNQTFKVVETVFSVLKWFGRSFHRVAAANMNDFLPFFVVLTWGTSNMFEYLKAYSYFIFAWYCFSMLSMSFIFVLFMLHLLTVCALYVCLCDCDGSEGRSTEFQLQTWMICCHAL